MNLTTKIFKIFTLIFIAQLAVVGIWAFSLYSSNNKDQYPASVVNSLTKVDRSILEGIILQNKMGSPLARDLVAYRLLELNNVDSAEFIKPINLPTLINNLKLKNCSSKQDLVLCSTQTGKTVVSLTPLKLGESFEGYLKLEKSLKLVEQVNKQILLTIGVTVLVVFVINVFTIIMIWWMFLKPETLRLLKVFQNEKEDTGILIKEYAKIQDSFLDAISRFKKSESEKINLESQLQKMNLATQVAHDIRSPLEVLKGLKDEMSTLPEASRRRVQLSINRIEEITFNLLKTNKQGIEDDKKHRLEELLGVVTSVVTEKNIEYRNFYDVIIRETLDSSSYGLFSIIQRSSFKSILSNLVNNSVESFYDESGLITISLRSEMDFNIISVSDNGAGIDSDIFEKIFSKGFTSKRTGNGLGLYNAKKDIESFGGTIGFESEVGKGATFIIALPKVEAPISFLSSIDATKYERIIVLDDDSAFHEVWDKRLQGLESKIEHIHSVEEMFLKYKALNPKILLLSDFELMDKKLDGIDTILKLNHAAHSILVTARNEEQAVQNRCLENGIKLLSKSLVNYVKIISTNIAESSASESAQAAGEAYGIFIEGGQARTGDKDRVSKSPVVLIDDDRLIHLNWAAYCKKNSLPFHSFYSIETFLAASTSLDKASRIYIDSNLGDGIKGEVESEKIYQLGFLNLYLATGYEKESINKPLWIKEVYSKSPEGIS